jgi:exopolyphosphatase/guanosine-5'-triphosphate,3'-diphosphate pyrophosphatase
LVDPEPSLRAVPVHKARTRYQVSGGIVELTNVAANGRTIWTLAVESADPAAVIAAVTELGLTAAPNLSYPRALRGLVGLGPDPVAAGGGTLRVAVIDVGTNSVKFHIGERDGAGHWQRVLDRAEVTRLGEGLRETGEITPQAQRRTLEAICAMVAEAGREGADAVVALGTMGLRIARNSDAFIAAVRERCGVGIEVIDGETEARLAYLAVEAGVGLPDGAVTVFETGGGSTQVTIGQGGRIRARFSLDVGAVRLTEQFALDRAAPRETLGAALAVIAGDLDRLDGEPPPDMLVGMGGAVTNLACVSLGMTRYDPDRVQGAILTREEVERQIALYAGVDGHDRRRIHGLQPGRESIILAGALVVLTLMDKLGKDRLSVSDRGLRHGVLIERFSV